MHYTNCYSQFLKTQIMKGLLEFILTFAIIFGALTIYENRTGITKEYEK